jgi:hypothetical protein
MPLQPLPTPVPSPLQGLTVSEDSLNPAQKCLTPNVNRLRLFRSHRCTRHNHMQSGKWVVSVAECSRRCVPDRWRSCVMSQDPSRPYWFSWFNGAPYTRKRQVNITVLHGKEIVESWISQKLFPGEVGQRPQAFELLHIQTPLSSSFRKG